MKSNKLILGTAQFGLDYGINNSKGRVPEEEVFRILNTALENETNFLDTAEAYGDSQNIIGHYHRVSKKKFNVITKFSAKRSDLPVKLYDRVRADIEILNVDSLYTYMFHSFSDLITNIISVESDLIKLKQDNHIKKIGVSLYTNEEVEETLRYDIIDLIQLPFNLLDNNTQRLATLAKIKKKGIEIHTRSVFLQGLFFKDLKQLPEKLQPLLPYLIRINEIASTYGIDIASLALNYTLQQPDIDGVLIGVDSETHLYNHLSCIKKDIPLEAFKQVDLINVIERDLLNPSLWNK